MKIRSLTIKIALSAGWETWTTFEVRASAKRAQSPVVSKLLGDFPCAKSFNKF